MVILVKKCVTFRASVSFLVKIFSKKVADKDVQKKELSVPISARRCVTLVKIVQKYFVKLKCAYFANAATDGSKLSVNPCLTDRK